MSTRKLHVKSFLSEFSDDDFVSALLTDDDDDEQSSALSTSTQEQRRRECPKPLLIAGLALTLLVLSLVAIVWKKVEKPEFVPPSGVVVPPLKDPPNRRVLAGRLGIVGSARNASSLPRNKQFMVPGKRAFAGEPTTEFSMMEIADVNIDSLRTTKVASPETHTLAEPEVHEPFRQEPFTIHWRSAVGRKDVGPTTKSPRLWLNNVNDTLSVTPNLVRRFIGRRRFPEVSTTPAIAPSGSGGRIWGIENSNISIYVIRVGRNTSDSANTSSAGPTWRISGTGITASSAKATFGSVDWSSSAGDAAESFITWDRLPDTSDKEPPTTKVATSTGVVPDGSVTERRSKTGRDVSEFIGDKIVVPFTGAPNAHDTSRFGMPLFASHGDGATGKLATTQSSVSGRRRQDKTDGEIGRIIPVFDFDEHKKNDSSLDTSSIPSQKGLSHSTELTVSPARDEMQGLNESKRDDVTPLHFTGVAGQKTAAVGADVKTHRVEVEKPESLFNGSDSTEPPAGGTSTNETPRLSRSVSTVADDGMSVALSGSNITTLILNMSIIESRNNILSSASSLPEKSTTASDIMPIVVSSSPMDVLSNGGRNLPTFSTVENEKTVNKDIEGNEAVSRSAQNKSNDFGSADIGSQPITVTKQRESETPPVPSSGGKLQDNIILDIDNEPSKDEAALKNIALGQPANGTLTTVARTNRETVASVGSNASLADNVTEHNENHVETEATSTTDGQSNKKYGGLLKVGFVPENASRADSSPLNLFPDEGAQPSAQPSSSSNDSFSVVQVMNDTKHKEKKEALDAKNNLRVQALTTTKGMHEERTVTKQRGAEDHRVENTSREYLSPVNKTTTGFDARSGGGNTVMSSGSTNTVSGLLGSKPSTEPSATGSPRDVGRSGEGGGAKTEVQETPFSSHETPSTSPSAVESSLSLSGKVTTSQISSHRTRRRIRMSRRGRYRKRLITKTATVEKYTIPTTLENTEQTRNRYPPIKHAKKKHHAKLTPAGKLSSEYGNSEADKRHLQSKSSKEGSYDTSENAGEAKHNTERDGENGLSTTTGSYKRKIKAVEITHRHGLDEKSKATVTKNPKTITPSENIRIPVIANKSNNDSELSSDRVNDTDTLDGIYQHAGMNIWKIPKDVSGLQKEHPGHKRKPRPRDNRRLPPRLIPKHAALTRPPYKAPIEWSAERKRPPFATSSISLLKTTLATASVSSPSSMSLTQVSIKTTASPGMANEALEAGNNSRNHAPLIHTFSHELNDTDLNATETSGGNASANTGRELKDLRPLSFNSSIEQTNETGSTAAKFLGKEASARTTTATVVTLVPVEDSATAVRCPTADCMEEGGRLRAFTDLTQKPCTNFYEFACSGWVRSHPYPPNRKKVSVDDLVVQITEQKTMEFIYENVLDHATYTDPLLHNVVKIFQGCSDKSFLMRNPAMALQAALDDVRLTDWPYDEEPMDVEVPEVIAFAARKLAVHPFFAPSLETDSTTGSGWVFVFREPKAVIPEDAYVAGDVVVTYQKMVTKAMSLVNSDKNIQALAEPVLDVDQEVYKMVEKSRRLTDYTREHHRKSLPHLDKRREFDVGSFLSTLVDGIAVLDSEVEFVIPTATFLEDVQNITIAFEKNVLLNYIGFRAVLALSPLLPHNDGRDLAHLQFVREIPTRTPAKRWRFCLRLLEAVYKLPLLQLQVDSFEKKDNFHTINRTMELLKKHLFRTVRNSSRFGQSQRQAIIAKLRDLKVQSFSSHFIGDSEVRERHYHGVPDVDPSNVLTDYVQTLNIFLKNYWSYYGSLGPQFRWHGSIFDTAATYNHFENTLYIPPSLFMEDVKYNTYHSPLYFPRSGRRIMEGMYSMLEREASFFGPHNEVVKTSSWDYTTTDGYLSLRGCLKEQFRKAAMPHLVPGLTSALQPSRPLRQDVKDNAMINVVFEAFKETMLDFGYKPGLFILPGFAATSMDQLFFLLYGTSHCEVTSQEAALADEIISASHPRRYRVNHALQNSRIFSEAFMCSNNTDMNPKNKCKVW